MRIPSPLPLDRNSCNSRVSLPAFARAVRNSGDVRLHVREHVLYGQLVDIDGKSQIRSSHRPIPS